MTSDEILKADLLDILFENRNKQYGAFTLRKNYNNRLGFSLGISLATMFFVFLLLRTNGSQDLVVEAKDGLILTPVAVPKTFKPELPVVPKAKTISKPAAAQQFTQLEIVNDVSVDNEVASQDDLMNAAVANHTEASIGGGGDVLPVETGQENAGKPAEKKEVTAVPMIQKEPEFPGGVQAWLKFLNKHLIVPGELEPGEKKSVVIRFKVAEDGSVTAFEVLQSAGNIYDNEVMRVLKKMPRWKPAIQNNEPVSRSFTQPVTFMGLGD